MTDIQTMLKWCQRRVLPTTCGCGAYQAECSAYPRLAAPCQMGGGYFCSRCSLRHRQAPVDINQRHHLTSALSAPSLTHLCSPVAPPALGISFLPCSLLQAGAQKVAPVLPWTFPDWNGKRAWREQSRWLAAGRLENQEHNHPESMFSP